MLRGLERQAWQAVPGAFDGPGLVNVANGNLVVRISPPSAGRFAPYVVLTYNSKSTQATEYGYGWSALYSQKVTEITSTKVEVTKGTGTVLCYTDKNASGIYRPPGGVPNTLKKNSDGTWTETQPDGFKLHYDTVGKLVRLSDIAGSRWTLSHDAGGRVTKILDPFNRRTTQVYDGANKIRRIQDAAGRITSYTVNASGDLVRQMTPDGLITTLAYDASHRLTVYRDVENQRTSYTYCGLCPQPKVTLGAECHHYCQGAK